jgi:hypothetical protein
MAVRLGGSRTPAVHYALLLRLAIRARMTRSLIGRHYPAASWPA